MVTAAGRKVLQKAIFSFWERIPRRKTGELQKGFDVIVSNPPWGARRTRGDRGRRTTEEETVEDESGGEGGTV